MSSRLDTPPLATTWQLTAWLSWSSMVRLGPARVPSWEMSVQIRYCTPQVLHAPGQLQIVHLALLQPALSGHLAPQGVDAHGHTLAIALHRLRHELGVPQGRGTQDYPGGPQLQVAVYRGHIPDAPAHFHLQAGALHHPGDKFRVFRGAPLWRRPSPPRGATRPPVPQRRGQSPPGRRPPPGRCRSPPGAGARIAPGANRWQAVRSCGSPLSPFVSSCPVPRRQWETGRGPSQSPPPCGGADPCPSPSPGEGEGHAPAPAGAERARSPHPGTPFTGRPWN